MRPFTLMELLIVIGIIAVLAAMLLPALNMAKNKVYTILCASNLRQAGTILTSYSLDSKGYGPYLSYSYKSLILYQSLSPYMPEPKKITDKNKTHRKQQFMSCPRLVKHAQYSSCASTDGTIQTAIGSDNQRDSIFKAIARFSNEGALYLVSYRPRFGIPITYSGSGVNPDNASFDKWQTTNYYGWASPGLVSTYWCDRIISMPNGKSVKFYSPSQEPIIGDAYSNNITQDFHYLNPSVCYVDGHVRYWPYAKAESRRIMEPTRVQTSGNCVWGRWDDGSGKNYPGLPFDN